MMLNATIQATNIDENSLTDEEMTLMHRKLSGQKMGKRNSL